MSILRLYYLQKVGGGGDICTGHPPTQKSGGYIPPPPGIYASVWGVEGRGSDCCFF